MKISVGICCPVIPLYKISLPCFSKLFFSNSDPTLSKSNGINTLPSPVVPSKLHTFANTHSTKCPTVIRLGIAWGLIIISGTIPSFVKGISCSGNIIPITPFCP